MSIISKNKIESNMIDYYELIFSLKTSRLIVKSVIAKVDRIADYLVINYKTNPNAYERPLEVLEPNMVGRIVLKDEYEAQNNVLLTKMREDFAKVSSISIFLNCESLEDKDFEEVFFLTLMTHTTSFFPKLELNQCSFLKNNNTIPVLEPYIREEKNCTICYSLVISLHLDVTYKFIGNLPKSPFQDLILKVERETKKLGTDFWINENFNSLHDKSEIPYFFSDELKKLQILKQKITTLNVGLRNTNSIDKFVKAQLKTHIQKIFNKYLMYNLRSFKIYFID